MPGPPAPATPYDNLIPLEEQTPYDDLVPVDNDLFKVQNTTVDRGYKGTYGGAKQQQNLSIHREALKKVLITNQLKKTLANNGGYDEHATFNETAYDAVKTMDIGRSDSLLMKRKKFLDAYPEGRILTVPTEYGPIMVARKNSQTPYRQLSGFLEGVGAIDEGDVGATIGSLAYAEGGPLVGSIATGVGAAGGEMLKDTVEYARGYGERDSIAGSAIGSLDDAATGALFEGAGRFLMRGNPPGPFVDEAIRTATGASRQGLPPLTRGQVSAYPLITGLWGQAGKMSNVVNKTITKQEQAFLSQLRNRADERTLDAFSDDEIERLTRAQYDELNSLNTVQAMNRPEAGTILQTGIDFFKRASGRLVDRRYSQAFKLGADDAIMWDLSPAKTLARRIARGTLGNSTDPENPLIRMSQPLTGDLRNVVATILDADPAVSKVGQDSGFQQLKDLRSQLWDIKNGNDSFAAAKANELWQSLTKIIDNPVNGNEAFTNAWKRASQAYAERSEILSRNYAKKALKDNTAEELARRYYTPGKAMELAEIKQILTRGKTQGHGAQEWDYFRQGFVADLLRDSTQSGSAITRLNNWARTDPEGLALLLNPSEERMVRKAATMSDYINSGPMQKVLARDRTEGERVMHIISNGTEKELSEIVKKAGGIESDQAISMRAGVWQHLLDNSTVKSTDAFGADVINPERLVTAVDELRKSRKLNSLFRAEDWQALNDYTRYAVVIGRQGDVGGGMQAGGTRSVLSQLGSHVIQGEFGKIWRGLIRPAFSNEMTARILASPRSGRQLQQSKDISTNPLLRKIRAVLDGAAVATKDMGINNIMNEMEPEYLDDFAPAPIDVPPPQPSPALPPPPGVGQQGALVPPPAQSAPQPQRMGSYLPPTPATQMPGPLPQQMSMSAPNGDKGQKYAMLFPQDGLGQAIAGGGGIASL